MDKEGKSTGYWNEYIGEGRLRYLRNMNGKYNKNPPNIIIDYGDLGAEGETKDIIEKVVAIAKEANIRVFCHSPVIKGTWDVTG
jgi:hypothetical protein